MNSLVKCAHIYKRIIRSFQLYRHISTSKQNQELCVTNAEITDQEPVNYYLSIIFL